MEIKKLIENIEQWGKDRELDKKATVEGQAVKTAEEMAELIIGISKDKIDVIEDSIGDVFVTLVIGNMIDKKFDFKSIYEKTDEDYERRTQYFIYLKPLSLIDFILSNTALLTKLGYEEENLKDIIYLLMRISERYGLKFVECVESAYKEIKDRKGKMINGQFVKEADLWFNLE